MIIGNNGLSEFSIGYIYDAPSHFPLPQICSLPAPGEVVSLYTPGVGVYRALIGACTTWQTGSVLLLHSPGPIYLHTIYT